MPVFAMPVLAMHDWLFLKSILAGLAIAAPVGPVGVLCVHRTVLESRLHGLVSGLGAAVADALYGCIAAFGLAALAHLLLDHTSEMQLAGGILLLGMGIHTYRKRTAALPKGEEPLRMHSLLGDFFTTFVLTLINPITILAFAGIFVALGVFIEADRALLDPILVVLGVFIGSCLWWFGIALGAGLLRGRLDIHHLEWMNRISGTLIFVFGAAALIDLAL